MSDKRKLIDDQGIRRDGRKYDELRPLKIGAGVLKRADGSAFVDWGDNKVLVAVYGPRRTHPRYLQKPDRAIVQCRYNMAPFSTDDRKRPGLDRRSTEISKLLSEALEHVVFLKRYPKSSIDVYVEVLQADAGTRCAGLVGASVALADAGIPMRDLVPSVAVGKINGQLVLDLFKDEDMEGDADVPIAYVPTTEEVILLQMDGHLSKNEFFSALDMGIDACEKIYEIQRNALKSRYSTAKLDPNEDTEKEIYGGDSHGK